MEPFLQKYSWAINFALIGLGTLLSALFVNSFVASQLAELTVPKMPPFHVESDRGQVVLDDGERDFWVDALAQRCLFGCPEIADPDECPDGCPDGEVCEFGQCVPEEYEEEEFDDVPRLTELELKLTGVMVAQNPRWSMAMIQNESDRETHVVGVGDTLPLEEPVEVLEIRRDRVFIDNGGRLEFVRLEDSPYGDPEPEPRAQRPSGGQANDRRARAQRQESEQRQRDDDRSGVVAGGENQYTVDRSRIESALADEEQLSREARVMPNYRDGEPDGLRLVGVRPDSFYSDLGIRSGDVIHSVNGRQLTNQRQALEMLETMRTNKEVTIEIERRGQRQEMEYNIR